jgi:hypothetical protein
MNSNLKSALFSVIICGTSLMLNAQNQQQDTSRKNKSTKSKTKSTHTKSDSLYLEQQYRNSNDSNSRKPEYRMYNKDSMPK